MFEFTIKIEASELMVFDSQELKAKIENALKEAIPCTYKIEVYERNPENVLPG